MPEINAVESMKIMRNRERPTIHYYIDKLFDDFFELHGDRLYSDDTAVRGGIARFNSMPVTVIGHVKGRNTTENIASNFAMPHPEGYRKALRLMHQAEKFGRPVICFVDTSGAYCGVGAEERGQGEAIARNLMEMMFLKVPVISIVTGEGGSGGALALAVANRVYMLENAIYSVISPKGFASILWKDPSREQEAASVMKITSRDLLSFGVVDGVIEEPGGGAHKSPRQTADNIRACIEEGLGSLYGLSAEELVSSRYEKFRATGVFSEA